MKNTTQRPNCREQRLVRRRKCAAIIAPIPGTDGMKWLCIAVDGNLQWKTSCECDSREDAEAWAKKTRKHWRKFPEMLVCHRLAPNASAQPPAGDTPETSPPQ